ncbi:MAG: lipid asymmetry maintenance protein MlaB [Methylococcaceae bacterium]
MPTFNIIKQSDKSYCIEGELTFSSLNKKNIKSFGFLKTTKEVHIDLSKVSAADSAGLALMIEWIKHSKLYGSKLTFKNIPQQLITLAKLSSFDITDLNNS